MTDENPPRGIRILIRLENDRAHVRYLTRVHEWRHRLIPGGLRASTTFDTFLVTVLDANRIVRGQAALSWETEAFGDRPHSRFTDGLAGGQLDIQDDRLLEFEMPSTGAFVALGHVRARARARSDAAGSVGVFTLPDTGDLYEPLGIFHLGGQPSDVGTPWSNHSSEPLEPTAAEAISGLESRELRRASDASITRPYRIALISEGFQASERQLFEDRADVLMRGLLKVRPFSDLAQVFSATSIFVPSHDSGVDCCPYPSSPDRRTAFDVTGNFKQAGYAGFFGTDATEKIEIVIDQVFPRRCVDLVVVIVNSAIYGGRAAPDQRTVFVPIHFEDETFVNLAAHECGHVIARLREEYIGCVVKDPPDGINVVSEKQRLAGVWWQQLAEPSEISGNCLKAVHRFGDPLDPDTLEPRVPDESEGALGLFWGAQYITSTAADPCRPRQGCDPYADPRGALFYRPMARCKMRRLKWDFCRVCVHLLERSIREAISPQRPTAVAHAVADRLD